VIDDESEEVSRSGTPAPPPYSAVGGNDMGESNAETGLEGDMGKDDQGSEAVRPTELPPDVRAKLRKLEKLESRYQGSFIQQISRFL